MVENIKKKQKGLNSCSVADAAGLQPPLLWVMASVIGYCIILVRLYGNGGLGSNEPVVLNVHLQSRYSGTAGLLIFLKLLQNRPKRRDQKSGAVAALKRTKNGNVAQLIRHIPHVCANPNFAFWHHATVA